jgi:hypothetical protein
LTSFPEDPWTEWRQRHALSPEEYRQVEEQRQVEELTPAEALARLRARYDEWGAEPE